MLNGKIYECQRERDNKPIVFLTDMRPFHIISYIYYLLKIAACTFAKVRRSRIPIHVLLYIALVFVLFI